MTWAVPAGLRIPWNADALAFLERTRPSAHSDVASELSYAARGLPGVRAFCPAPAGYAWVALHTPEGRVFGLAYGMRALVLRLGPHDAVAALRDRGEREARALLPRRIRRGELKPVPALSTRKPLW